MGIDARINFIAPLTKNNDICINFYEQQVNHGHRGGSSTISAFFPSFGLSSMAATWASVSPPFLTATASSRIVARVVNINSSLNSQ